MVRLRSLGECVIELGETEIGPESEILFALLLYLIVERGRRVPRARLVELLWPGETDERARHNLRQAIYKAKQLGAPIALEGGDVVLPAAAATADHEELSAESDDATVRPVDLASVEFLPSYAGVPSDAYAEWLDGRRAVVESAIRRHLVVGITRARRLARWPEVERLARRCLALDPMNEEAVVGLAESTAATGGRAEAVAIIDRYLAELGPSTRTIGARTRDLRNRVLDSHHRDLGARSTTVGREAEFAMLSDLLSLAIEGEGHACLVWGAPGIGKSVVLHDLVQLARLRGVAVLSVYSQHTTQPHVLSTYTSIVDGLLQLPGALGCAPEALSYCRLLTESHHEPSHIDRQLGALALQRRIQDSVVDLARAVADETPVLIAIEDAHWADSASIEYLALLAQALRRSRILITLTSREMLVWGWRDGPMGGLRIIEMKGLSPEASRKLLLMRRGDTTTKDHDYVEWCLRAASGHPLYLRELGDRWRQIGPSYEMPPSLISLLAGKLDSLSSLALRALQFCALLDRESNLRRLEQLLGLPLREFTNVVEELERADVAATDGTAFVTRHELISGAALARVTGGTLRLLHRQLALILESEIAGNTSATLSWRCAQHWLLAHEQQRASSAMQAAATRLIRIGLPGEAVTLVRAYLAATGGSAQPDQAVEVLIAAHHSLYHWTSVLESGATVASPVGSEGPRHSPAELHMREAAFRSDSLDLRSLLTAAEKCVFARDVDDEHRLDSAFQASVLANDLFDRSALRRVHRRVAAQFPIARESSVHALRCHLVHHTVAGDLSLAVNLAQECVRMAEVSGDPIRLSHALRNVQIPLRLAGRIPEALVQAERALRVAESLHHPSASAYSAASLAIMHLAGRNYTKARRLANKAMEHFADAEPANGRSDWHGIAATVALFAGDLPEAAEFGLQLPMPRDDTSSRYFLGWLALRTISAVHTGEREFLEKSVDALVRGTIRGARWGSCDTIALATIYSLGYLGRQSEASLLVRQYTIRRRERYALPEQFSRALGCGTARQFAPPRRSLSQPASTAVCSPREVLEVDCRDPDGG